MVGGGIFAVLGLAVVLAGGGTPVAFALAGGVAAVTSYSYARLSVTFPDEGGTVTFLNRAFGDGRLPGSLNVLLWVSYLVMLSLYSFACGSYGATFFPEAQRAVWKHVILSGAIVGFTLINASGATFVGRAEKAIVGIKLVILLFVAAVGVFSVKAAAMAPATWGNTALTGTARAISLVAGGMIIFVAYEGFELIANTANDVKNAARLLPRAYYVSVGFVIALYIVISIVTVGNLPLKKIAEAQDYALAAAAQPFLGHFGFVIISVAALLATCSAINATLYGAARISYIIARDGELPRELTKKHMRWVPMPLEGLILTCVFSLLVANFFDLTSISTMGSAGFLLIFAAVNLANVVLARETSSRAWVSVVGTVVCLGALGALIWQTAATAPAQLWVLVVMFGVSVLIETVYRAATGRRITLISRSPRSCGHGR